MQDDVQTIDKPKEALFAGRTLFAYRFYALPLAS